MTKYFQSLRILRLLCRYFSCPFSFYFKLCSLAIILGSFHFVSFFLLHPLFHFIFGIEDSRVGSSLELEKTLMFCTIWKTLVLNVLLHGSSHRKDPLHYPISLTTFSMSLVGKEHGWSLQEG